MEEQNIEENCQITEVFEIYQLVEKHIKYLESNILEEEDVNNEEARA